MGEADLIVLNLDLAAADRVGVHVVGVAPADLRPLGQEPDALGLETFAKQVEGLHQRAEMRRRHGDALGAEGFERRRGIVGRRWAIAEMVHGRPERPELAGDLSLRLRPRLVVANDLRDVLQVADAARRDDRGADRLADIERVREAPIGPPAAALGQPLQERHIDLIAAAVVELARDRRVHRHGLRWLREARVGALIRLAHVAQRVRAARLVVFVHHDHVRQIDHLDLLELGLGAELRRHHIHGQIRQIRDRRIRLSDAARLDQDEVEAERLAEHDGLVEGFTDLAARSARGERAHEHALAIERVHPDPIAQKRPAGPALCRIDR